MFDFLVRGLLMDEAGDGGGVAVADTSSDYGGDSGSSGEGGTDGQVHDAEFTDPGTEGAPTHEEGQEPGTALVKSGERAVVNGKFTQSGRAIAETVKPLGRQAYNDVVQALMTRDYFLKEFPGGKKDVIQLRKLSQSTGGEQGISKMRSTLSFFLGLDNLFSDSDPRFIDEITSTEDEQRAFVGLMPAAFDKFEKLGGAQFGHQIAKRFEHLMNTPSADGQGNYSPALPVLFSTMTAILNRAGTAYKAGDMALASSFLSEIIDNYNSIHDFFTKVLTTAHTAPAAPGSAKDPALDSRAQQLSQREQALQKQEWERAVSDERRRLFSKAWAEVTKGRTLTGDQESNVKGFYDLRLTKKIRNWQNQAERFFANSDKDGYLREQYAFFRKAIPEELHQAIRQAIPAKPGPKGERTPVKSPVNGRATADRNGNAIRVAKMPPTSQLDPVRTTEALLSQNKAYQKDGRLVTWA